MMANNFSHGMVGPNSILLYGTLPHKWADDPIGVWQGVTLSAVALHWSAIWEEFSPMAIWLPTQDQWDHARNGDVGLAHVERATKGGPAQLSVVAWAGMSDHHADARLWVRGAELSGPWESRSVWADSLADWGAGMTGTLGDYT